MAKCVLNFGQKIKLIDWLRTNKDRLVRERPTFEKLSKDLSGMFEVELSAQSLRRLMAGIDLDWRPVSTGDGGHSRYTHILEQLESLSNRLAKLEIGLGVKQVPVVQQNLPLTKGV